jgi:hypothetical protein
MGYAHEPSEGCRLLGNVVAAEKHFSESLGSSPSNLALRTAQTPASEAELGAPFF